MMTANVPSVAGARPNNLDLALQIAYFMNCLAPGSLKHSVGNGMSGNAAKNMEIGLTENADFANHGY